MRSRAADDIGKAKEKGNGSHLAKKEPNPEALSKDRGGRSDAEGNEASGDKEPKPVPISDWK